MIRALEAKVRRYIIDAECRLQLKLTVMRVARLFPDMLYLASVSSRSYSHGLASSYVVTDRLTSITDWHGARSARPAYDKFLKIVLADIYRMCGFR